MDGTTALGQSGGGNSALRHELSKADMTLFDLPDLTFSFLFAHVLKEISHYYVVTGQSRIAFILPIQILEW